MLLFPELVVGLDVFVHELAKTFGDHQIENHEGRDFLVVVNSPTLVCDGKGLSVGQVVSLGDCRGVGWLDENRTNISREGENTISRRECVIGGDGE